MRSVVRVGLLGVILAAVVGVPASAAPRWRAEPRLDAHAAAGRAVQGGTLVVGVRVRLPRRYDRSNPAPVAKATVHFASGDVTVDLTGRTRELRGHGYGHRGWWTSRSWRGIAFVPVSATEQVGRVKVDVTVTLGDGSVTVATFGRIFRSRTTPDPDPDPEQPCTAGCQEL